MCFWHELKRVSVNVFRIVYMYLFWISIHYAAAQFYVQMCVPQTIIGFLSSPFLAITPQCQGMRWIVYIGGDVIQNMWVALGTFLCIYMFKRP